MKPELPEDLALHFHISSVYLVLTVLTITQTTKRPSSVSQGCMYILATSKMYISGEQCSECANVVCVEMCRVRVRGAAVAVIQTLSGSDLVCEYI